MAVAANVKTVITIKGQDRASREVNKASSSIGRLNKAVQSAQSSMGRMGQAVRSAFSGDVAGAVGSVSGLLGGAGGFAGAAAAATAGTAALGAAVAVAAYKFTEWSVEIERTRAALDSTFGAGKGVETAIGFARAIGGVGVESVAKLATTLKATGISAQITAAQMQELTARATTMGKSGDEALTAFADAVQKGNTRALQSVGTFINAGRVLDEYAKAAGKTTTELTQYEKQVAVLNAVQEDLGRSLGSTSTRFDQQDRLLARLDIAWTTLKFRVSEYLSGPAAGVLENVVETVETFARWGRVIGAIGSALAQTFSAQLRAAGTAIGGLSAAMATFVQTGSLTKAATVLDAATLDVYKIAVTDTADAWRKVGDAAAQGGQKVKAATEGLQVGGGLTPILEQLNAAGKQAGKVSAEIGAKLAKGAAARAAAGRRAAQAARALAKRQDEEFFRDLKALREQDARDAIDLRRREILAMDEARRQMAQAIQSVDRERQVAFEAEIDRIERTAQARASAEQAAISEAFAIANAGVNAVEQVVGANRALAGVRAGIMAAEAVFSFASGNIPAGIAKAAAAVDMARQALTAAPTVSTPTAPAGPAGGGISGPSPSSGGGAAPVYNIVLNGVMTTRAEVGAAIDKATKAAQMAGMAGA